MLLQNWRKKLKECMSCKNKEFYISIVNSCGGYGPYLLPGTNRFFELGAAKFKIQVCTRCGFVHWYVAGGGLDKIKKSTKFSIEKY